jgi:glycerol-3-phosphate O-acyltransferase/dihydroxyacetone phosphate acyltransferase
MLYYLAKFIMWFTVRVYFRKVSVTGAQHIPDGKPVILIVNHSASFLDAILLGSLLKRQLYFYARSDVFKAGLAFRLMKMVHMIPIYNMEHSKEDLHRNIETFDEGEKALARKKMLVIFPEGISRQERILLPLKKGTARVAVHAASKQGFEMGLEIIPVGINYTFHRFRSDVVLTVGETTQLIDYAETYAQNPNKAIAAITRDIEKKFAATVIFVDQANRTDLINHLLFYFQNDFEWDNKHPQQGSLIKREKEICNAVSAMEDEHALLTWQQVSRYSNLLKASGLKDQSITGRSQPVIIHLLAVLFGLPFAIGAIPALPIVFLAKRIGDKTVTRIDFYTSVTLAAGGVAFFLYWLILVIISLISGNTLFIVLTMILPMNIYIFFKWLEALHMLISGLRLVAFRKNNVGKYNEMKTLRDSFSFWRNQNI